MAEELESAAGTAEPDGSAPASPPPASPRTYRRRLSNLVNVKTGLADVFRKLESGALEPRRANAMTYTLVSLSNIITGSELEERLRELEGRGFAAKAAKARRERAAERQLAKAARGARSRP
jgi:hypothetical protein